MDQHYVCTGTCKTVSDQPKTCSNTECTRNGQEFVACSCTDGNHDEAFKKTSEVPI